MRGRKIKTILGDLEVRSFPTALIPSKPKMSPRDTRRIFTPTQKNEILHQQNGRCAGTHCRHQKLDPRAIYFHHGKAWSSGGKTIVQNGYALCPLCHKLATHKQQLEKVDRRR
ncbi:MAG: hypothetical protein QXX08_09105 [Candidatus Bathyarchaeia archaeon]